MNSSVTTSYSVCVSPDPACTEQAIRRVIVATLADARREAKDIVLSCCAPGPSRWGWIGDALRIGVNDLNWTVGPLPGGTKISVEPISDRQLIDLARGAGWEPHDGAFIDGARLSKRGRESARHSLAA
jgi:hypothetical protein